MKILITGGTGTIGKALLKKLSPTNELVVFSRDELKQSQLKADYPNVKFIIGDVRDYSSVKKAFMGMDAIIHAGAMKRIEVCEEHPMEAIKTNVIGTENVVNVARELGIKKLISIGSDKGVEPVNAYGMTKALQEIITTNAGFNCARYGNVFSSRGSVVPLFLHQKSQNMPLTITNPEMTRFVLTIDDATEIILKAIESEMKGDIFVKKSPATVIKDIANAISDNTKIIGSFFCEKMHETLISNEEMARTEDVGDYYIIHRDKNSVSEKQNEERKYSSDSVPLLTVEEIKNYISIYYENK